LRSQARPGRLAPPAILFGLILLASAVTAAAAGPSSHAPGQPAPRVSVAVLPLQVHSAKSLDQLQRSIPELLQSHLVAAGRIDTVDPAVVKDAAARLRPEPDDAELRKLARELGADEVVSGSLTELAGHFSLDVRVTPRDPQVASQSMVFTAESEEALQDRVNELADRIIALASGTSRALVLDVTIESPLEVDPGVKGTLRTRVGQPYDGEAAREDVATLKALPGIATATVQAEYRSGGVAVHFRLVPAERILGSTKPASKTDRVADVRVRGNRRIEADAIRARISTKAGDPYNAARISSDVHAVFGLGFFRNVKVFSEETPDGRIVTFEVEENPVVRQVAISGNEGIEADKIRDALTLTTGSTLDYPLLYENTARIEALYRAQGYYLAKVHHTIQPISADAVSVTFEVDEGEKLRLVEIRFEGNHALSTSELTSGMQTKPWHFWSYVTTYLDKSGTYSEPVFTQDLRLVEQKYTDHGYLQVEVGEPRVEPEKDGLVVTVEIKEGDQFHVGKVDIGGDTTADVEQVRQSLKLKTGEVFNRSFLTKDVEALTHQYTDRGYYFANVNPETKLDSDAKVVDVTFQVERGSLYFIREIEVTGNTTTIDPVLRREMQLVEGQLWSARAIDVSKQRLQNLGFFEEVNFEPKPTDTQGQLDLGVKVVEKPTGSLSFGAGYSSQDKFIFSGSLAQSNLFGRGYGVQVSGDIGGLANRFFLSFSDPYFFDSAWSLGTTLYRTEVQYTDFTETRTGFDFSFGHALNEENTARGFAGYSYSQRTITQLSSVQATDMVFRESISGKESVSIASLSFRGEQLDNRIAPKEGYQYGGSLDFAGLGGFAKFLRTEGRVAYYLPAPSWFPLPSTFAFSARTGYTIPFNSLSDYNLGATGADLCPPDLLFGGGPGSVSDTIVVPRQSCFLGAIDRDLKLPLSERYFLGGLGTYQLRGYKARTVGPRRPTLYCTGFGCQIGVAANKQSVFAPLGVDPMTGLCDGGLQFQGNGPGTCNRLQATKTSQFNYIKGTDVVGGNKFLSLSVEYRFPISESLGLMGIVFMDMGNAFAENENMFDVSNWRYGTGVGALWFSPFGPLQGFLGFPLNPLKGVDSSVDFEFSVGGANF
jgi:outer membrane protein insertion porin family